MTYQDALNLIKVIEEENYRSNSWEEEFMQSITDRWENLTGKQSVCLNNIYAKATGGGRFQNKEYLSRG